MTRRMSVIAVRFGWAQVLLDFDRTLTKHHGPSGKPCEECHDIIFKHAALGEEFVQDIQKVLSAYDVDHSKMTEQVPACTHVQPRPCVRIRAEIVRRTVESVTTAARRALPAALPPC